ncbi:MAG: glycosyltransferase family 4 protein [Gammaproteobacteria bacterium]|nr:glycosyltransferase family 4 protein [Gammaproteobacteria bacterium]MYJ53003.1 glycosyltransferase family 4 protein [Gammaproteobacteria bacterium]
MAVRHVIPNINTEQAGVPRAVKRVAVVLKGYPRLSETFIAQELLALEEAGLDLVLYSLRSPTDHEIHPVHARIRAPVVYLPEYLYRHPLRVLSGLLAALCTRRVVRFVRVFLRDLARDMSANRVRRLGQAMVLYREIASDREWIYAHFLHTPSSVARYCSILSGLPWSCSAHAKDIWTTPKWEIREKLDDLRWLVTCTSANRDYLAGLARDPGRIRLLYHGLDLDRFPGPLRNHVNDGSTPVSAVRILSVGRAVPKKGYDVLLEALAGLPGNLHWTFVHVGAGPLLEDLKRQAAALNLDGRIDWQGPLSFDLVLEQYRRSDLFALASRVHSDGDRDGLPNVLMEAMAQGVPCVSTDISGIPELLRHDFNGLIVESGNVKALSEAICRLGRNPALRNSLGREGRRSMEEQFSLEQNVRPLVENFGG